MSAGSAEATAALLPPPERTARRGTARSVEQSPVADQTPRTALGRRLVGIRRRIEVSGQPLLSWDGIAAELAERRGDRRGDPDPKQ